MGKCGTFRIRVKGDDMVKVGAEIPVLWLSRFGERSDGVGVN